MTTRRGDGTASVTDPEGNFWVLGGRGSTKPLLITDDSEDLEEGYNLAKGTEVFKEATKKASYQSMESLHNFFKILTWRMLSRLAMSE